MRQSDIFMTGEGDAWFERNKDHVGEHDPVMEAMIYLDLKPKFALEIGCANGWRLARLRESFGCEIMGLDPSHEAANDGAKSRVPIWTATAAALPLRSAAYDLVIYGFCLYLTDPEDWFRIVAEGDRILKQGGHLIIHDFSTAGTPFARNYEHRPGLMSYHIDFEKFWLAHPWYQRIYGRSRATEDWYVTVLRKHIQMLIKP
jgi:ubiquinone/menaquinone biosynthesis C-methylase UbiE